MLPGRYRTLSIIRIFQSTILKQQELQQDKFSLIQARIYQRPIRVAASPSQPLSPANSHWCEAALSVSANSKVIQRTAGRQLLHRQNDTELRVAAHHARIGLS